MAGDRIVPARTMILARREKPLLLLEAVPDFAEVNM
jgi:hypothetical protein